MDYAELKARHRRERDGHPANLSLRVHRALSWLDRAERLEGDPDGQFIFLWIAFNAAYATEIDERYRLSEQETFRDFLKKLAELDAPAARLEQLLWQEFPGAIRVLLGNRYVFADFWSWQKGVLTEEDWQRRFDDARRTAERALARRDTVTVLAIVLSRVYTLRNQLVHGGATWNSRVNRDQVRDCRRFLGQFVPLVVEIMMDHPETLWGDPCYPVVEQ
jgi:hypothetical protein